MVNLSLTDITESSDSIGALAARLGESSHPMDQAEDNALAQCLSEAGKKVLALTDARARMRPAIQGQPKLRSLVAKWQGETISGMGVESFLYSPKSGGIFLNVATDRKGVYALVMTDLEPLPREDKAGIQYNLSKAEATIYNEQHIPKRKVDLSPRGVKAYMNVAEFSKFLRPAMRKLSIAVQGFMRSNPEKEK